MPVKGKTISFEQIKDALAKIPVNAIKETEQFIAGDHWQNQNGWTGWVPESTSKEAVSQFALVERLFNPKNVIGGIVKRIQGATLGKEPDWEIVPKADPKKAVTPTPDGEAPEPKPTPYVLLDQSLLQWWDDKQIHKQLKKFVANKAAYGKAALRIYIPAGFVRNNQVTVKDLNDALDKIFVEVPHPTSVVDVPDLDFGRKFTILALPKEDNNQPDRYEICYLDETDKTFLRQVSEPTASTNGTNETVQTSREIERDLGGNMLVIVEGEYDDALISDTVKHQQRSVNHAKTGENFALANINFPETTFINADLPTEKKTGSDGKSVEVVKPMAQGFGRWRSLIGLTKERADGSQDITTPEVIYREAADPERFAKVAENNTRDMHQETGMLYIYLADSEYASGESKVESMTDYLILLVDHKTVLDNVGVRLLDTVLRLAFTLTNDTSLIDKYDVIFSSKLTIGRVSNDDKSTMLEEVSKGLRSKRNYMITAEVTDDPAGELAVIATDTPLKDDPGILAEKTAEAQAKFAPKPAANPPKTTGASA